MSEALGHDIVFVGVQQLAALAIHECFFVRDHVLLIAIRFEECFRPGDVVEPNLRDTVEVGGGCPWQCIARSVILNVASNVFLLLQLGGKEGSMNFTPVLDELVVCKIAPTHHENTELDHCLLSPSQWATVSDIVILLST